jgi:PEP-CTERM motif
MFEIRADIWHATCFLEPGKSFGSLAMKSVKALAAALAFGVCSAASAAVVVDFTDRAWAAANGDDDFTLGGIQLTAGPSGNALLTFNAPDCDNTAVGLACQGDGIGIDYRRFSLSDDPTEVDPFETLRVTFLGGPVNVLDIHVLNLTYDFTYGLERIQIRANGGGAWQTFVAASSPLATGGYLETGFSASNVSYIEMRAADNTAWTGAQFSDASLARIAYNAVPVPATVALLGLGLLGVAGLSRRRA